MLRITADDLVTLDVLQVVHQDVLAEHVDEGLNVSRHLIHVVGLLQLAEVVVWEGRLKKLDIKLVPEQKITSKLDPPSTMVLRMSNLPEEYSGVIDGFLLAHVAPDLITQVQNCRNN